MKIRIVIATALLFSFSHENFSQVPLVYNKENTGANFKMPELPSLDKLPVIDPLPDPFII